MSSITIAEPAHATTRGSLLKAFAIFDNDDDGFLTKAEVTTILTRPIKNGEATVSNIDTFLMLDAFFLKLQANGLDADRIDIDDLIDELIPGDESPKRTKSASPNKRKIAKSNSPNSSEERSSSPSFIRTASRKARAQAAQALSQVKDNLSEASSFISRSFSRKSFRRRMAAGKARAERAAATARAAAAKATEAATKAARAALVPTNRARDGKKGRDDLGESSSFVRARARGVRVAAAAAASAALEAQRMAKVALRAAMLAESKKSSKDADQAASIAEKAAKSTQAAAAAAEKATTTMNRVRFGGSSMGTPGRSTGPTRGQPQAGRVRV